MTQEEMRHTCKNVKEKLKDIPSEFQCLSNPLHSNRFHHFSATEQFILVAMCVKTL